MGRPPGNTVQQLLGGLESPDQQAISLLEKRKPEREHPQRYYASRPRRGNNSNAHQRMKRLNIHTMQCYSV